MPQSQLAKLAKAVIVIHEKSPDSKIKVRAADGTYIEIDNREIKEAIQGSKKETSVIDKTAFHESYMYLGNAKDRLNTGTPEGYSDCKTNCRCALISVLKTLTEKEDVKEASKELSKQGILGKREQEFIESFSEMIDKLFRLDSKKGPHPPMTREQDDAELALSITSAVVNYVINQSTRTRT